MDEEWISAKDALAFMQRAAPITDQRRTICKRAYAGLIKARAATLILPSGNHSDANIGEDFWWAEGGAALEQNWVTGDFSTWINQKYQVKAFGVHFLADDIYSIVPGAAKAAGRWIESVDAVELVAAEGGVVAADALAAIIHCCGSQLIASRCTALSWQYSDRYETMFNEHLDNGVMPAWFWRTSARHPDAILNWRAGNFAGPGVTDHEDYCQAQAKGVTFERAELFNASEYARDFQSPAPAASSDTAVAQPDPHAANGTSRPRLPDAKLKQWWESKVRVRDSLSIDELCLLASAKFPDNHVARDRIRALASGRKRGPKTFGDKGTAE
ncbi:hypothetical protein K5P26_05390 [Sphingopyxis sp. XHP0097]|uniref:Uncharacterized protein n=1 Tax=Sphingopyxis jiangsuensis TaxID=2871171 RepID=A0ABS7MC24_9SPHN|nr:hypothetical protein [Sphingopyxis jiangsuensis]MBY4636569.1 hypothetical protein [Sphingopyxis jiangsuensis]